MKKATKKAIITEIVLIFLFLGLGSLLCMLNKEGAVEAMQVLRNPDRALTDFGLRVSLRQFVFGLALIALYPIIWILRIYVWIYNQKTKKKGK